MAANFPRIHSMTTVGIKQHFDCDYLFHPLRTDFSGESGSGKSMVADMIQLILVGTGAYKSATQSNSHREPKGMVLQPKGRQHGIGYILLNIETYPGKYIAIGACLESLHNRVSPFVVQGGYDWEETLTPLTRPVRYRDIKPSETIVPINELPGQLTELDLNLKQFSKKEFHKLLFQHELLPLDLTNDRTRKDYASILQSFSRDSGFKTDSGSLKNFLFGDDDQQRFQLQFKEEVASIDREFHDQQRFQEEIELIHQKEKALVKVAELKAIYRNKEKVFLDALNHHWHVKVGQDEEAWKEAMLTASRTRVEAEAIEAKQRALEVHELRALEQLLAKQQKLQEQKRPEVPGEYDQVKQQFDRLQQYLNWLLKHDNDPEKVAHWYASERKKAGAQALLSEFEQHLDQHDQRDIFMRSAWLTNYAAKRETYAQEKAATEETLNQLQALAKFSDIENEGSLGAWALKHLEFPVSYEQESVLIKFQQLQRQEPAPSTGMRYLPFPENLFDQLKIKHKAATGFWIDLDGVYEFIDYVPVQYLNKPSTAGMSELLNAVRDSADNDLREFQQEHDRNEELHRVLNEFSAVEKAIALFSDRDVVRQQTPETSLTPEEFKMYEGAYNKRLEVEAEYRQKHEVFEQATKKAERTANELEDLRQHIDKHQQYFDLPEVSSAAVRAAIAQRSELDWSASDERTVAIRKATESGLFAKEVTLPRVLQMKADHAEVKISAEAKEAATRIQLDQSRVQLARARDAYVMALGKDWIFNPEHPPVMTDPEQGDHSLKQAYQEAMHKFHHAFEFAKASADQPEQLVDYSIHMLAHKLLPTVFINSKFDEGLIKEQIAARLTKLTTDLQVIGSRKLEILKRVFSEVYSTYQGYLTKIQGINVYFRKKGITGGNRASLIYRKSPDYPEQWMAPFRNRLDEYSKEVRDGLFNDLKKEVHIYDMMKKAFQSAGGSVHVGHEELLNPKSYFDLEFDLKDANDQQNAGSQGQTYTAIALLCLARLSLIEVENRPGIRIMPIDEAQGLGSNYDMLHELAKAEKFQVLSMSIETAGDMKPEGQYVYIMNENHHDDTNTYVPPLGIFSDEMVQEDIDAHITSTQGDG